MKKPLLASLLMVLIPVIYMATFSLKSALVTVLFVALSILISEFTHRLISSQSRLDELHRRLSEKVKTLLERDLESELFKLSSKVEDGIKRDIEAINSETDSKMKSLDFRKAIPAIFFLINALILFFMKNELLVAEGDALIGIGAMMVLAHLAAFTPAPLSRVVR